MAVVPGSLPALDSFLSAEALLHILVRLPADSHATAVAVCPRFRALVESAAFRHKRRAVGYEEQMLVVAGGYGGQCCTDASCLVLCQSGWHELPDLPQHVCYTDATGVNEAAAVVVNDTFYLLGGESSGEPGYVE